jgi:hypothetical protein
MCSFGWMPRYGHKFAPPHVAVILVITSVGSMILGTSRSFETQASRKELRLAFVSFNA